MQVRASNAHGYSPWSPSATVTLTSAVGNLVATRVRGADGCSETINLTWGSYSAHSSTRAQFRLEPWYQWFDFSPDPTVREATLSNTNYWKWYKFRVRANVDGSAWSEIHVPASDATTMAAFRTGDHVAICAPVVDGATGYHFNFTTDYRRSWHRRGQRPLVAAVRIPVGQSPRRLHIRLPGQQPVPLDGVGGGSRHCRAQPRCQRVRQAQGELHQGVVENAGRRSVQLQRELYR